MCQSSSVVSMNNPDTEKLSSQSNTISLGKFSFNYGNVMHKQWAKRNNVFLCYFGSRFGQSVRVSLSVGEMVVT